MSSAKTLTKEQFLKFTQNMIKAGKVIGPKRKENKYAFAELSNARELAMDYDVTLQSPKVFFQPPREELFDFHTGCETKVTPHFSNEPFVLLGIHTYDLKALNQMDKIWAKDNADEHYLARRRNATIIALEPIRASKWSFWCWMDAGSAEEGFDLLLTDIGTKYVIEIGTEKGAKLLATHAPDAPEANHSDLDSRTKTRQGLGQLCNTARKVNASPSELPSLMKRTMGSPVWEKQAEKCYSCGSCNLVCPTCYCFDVNDNIELNLATGQRTRKWDGCLLESFAKVGSGENFREHRNDRFRHRLLRKLEYMHEKIGELACVGCGRCSEACLPDITDPVKIINMLKEAK